MSWEDINKYLPFLIFLFGGGFLIAIIRGYYKWNKDKSEALKYIPQIVEIVISADETVGVKVKDNSGRGNLYFY